MANRTGDGARAWAGRIVLLAVALVLIVTMAPTRAAAEPDDDAAPVPRIPQRYLDQNVAWQPCVFDSTIRRLAPAAPQTSCATVEVPMDWLHPGVHPDISIAIAYTPASGVSRGLLTADPGGPTNANRSFPAALAVDNPQLFTHYDLLGVDPRGYGASERLRCSTTDGRLASLSTFDPTDRSARGQAAREQAARFVARVCGSSELSGFVSSRQMAYDLAFVRVLLGYDRLSVLGYGSGARLAATYASLYPDGTDRLVLDSVPADLSAALAAPTDHGSDPVTGAAPGGISPAVAEAAQQRLTELYAWLARHDSSHWGTTAAQVADAYVRLRKTLDATHADLRGSQLDLALRLSLTDDDSVEQAADLLSAASALARAGMNGLTEDQAQLVQQWRVRLLANPSDRLNWAVKFARTQPRNEAVDLGPWPDVVRCNDLGAGVPAAQAWQATRPAAHDAPFVGRLGGVDTCTYWDPVDPDASPAPDLTDLPPGLVVQAGLDPFADLSAALRLHAANPDTVLVTVGGSGRHGLALSGRSACVAEIVQSYLFERPAGPLSDGLERAGLHDTACAARPLPGDDTAAPGPDVPGVAATAGPAPSTPVNPVLAGLWQQALTRS